MIDYRVEYWIEAVECALEGLEKQKLLTKDEIKYMAEALQGSAEQESMAFGCDSVSNPLEDRMREMKDKHDKEMQYYIDREYIFRKNFSDGCGPRVNPEDIYINGTKVEAYVR